MVANLYEQIRYHITADWGRRPACKVHVSTVPDACISTKNVCACFHAVTNAETESTMETEPVIQGIWVLKAKFSQPMLGVRLNCHAVAHPQIHFLYFHLTHKCAFPEDYTCS